jgi:hypothetical protein
MRKRLLGLIGVTAAIATVAVLPVGHVAMVGQAQTAGEKPGPAPKTAWGESDLQGIWTDEYQTPMQRPAKFANKEFFTDQERAELDKQRAALLRREVRVERGTEKDVAGAYNSVFTSIKHAGRRTSLIVDPPDGRIPELTPEAKRLNDLDRAYRLTLLQSTVTCKNKEPACAGGTYNPNPSPRYDDPPPFYNVARQTRFNGPEDGSLSDRCMSGIFPDFAGYKRIVQTPGGITMFYDTQQGQGWQRNIVMNGSPHLPPTIRQWWGDSRGHWEGNTLVVDVTNFSPKSTYPLSAVLGGVAAHDSLHVVERWTRLDAKTLEYGATIEDRTVWTKPFTVKQELTRQDDRANRIYYEPRCFEGNYGLPSLLLGTRNEEVAYAEGRGPHPATKDRATCFAGDSGEDALAGF